MLYLDRMCQCWLLAVLLLLVHVSVHVSDKWYTFQKRVGTARYCRITHYPRTFIPLSVSLWIDLANPVFDGVGLAGFKSNVFLLT